MQKREFKVGDRVKVVDNAWFRNAFTEAMIGKEHVVAHVRDTKTVEIKTGLYHTALFSPSDLELVEEQVKTPIVVRPKEVSFLEACNILMLDPDKIAVRVRDGQIMRVEEGKIRWEINKSVDYRTVSICEQNIVSRFYIQDDNIPKVFDTVSATSGLVFGVTSKGNYLVEVNPENIKKIASVSKHNLEVGDVVKIIGSTYASWDETIANIGKRTSISRVSKLADNHIVYGVACGFYYNAEDLKLIRKGK